MSRGTRPEDGGELRPARARGRALGSLGKRAAREALFQGVRLSRVPLLLRTIAQRSRVTILCFHDPTPEAADRAFRFLTRRYTPITLGDFVAAHRRGALGELPPRSVVITLDDGHKNNAALLEVIRRHKVPVTIFLTSGIVGTQRGFWFAHPLEAEAKAKAKVLPNRERLQLLAAAGFAETQDAAERQALSDPEISALQELVDFQSHTRFHPCLPRCTDEEAEEELAGSRAELEAKLGRPVYAIAYPNGDSTERDRRLARRAGYTCGLTTDPGFAGPSSDLFRLPRFVVEDDASLAELEVSASGAWGWLRPALKRLAGRGASIRLEIDERRD